MKKTILLLLSIIFSINVISQEKGSYIKLSGGTGISGFMYDFAEINFAIPTYDLKLGWQTSASYSYYFTELWGVSTGLGVSQYRSQCKLNGAFQENAPFILGNYAGVDPFDGHATYYELRVRTRDWEEQQKGYFLEIPLMANFHAKFGANERWGLFANLGCKFQLPLKVEYQIIDGEHASDYKLNVSGYYAERNLELGGPHSPGVGLSGFGSTHNPSEVLTYEHGRNNIKFNISMVSELGFLFSLCKRIDVALGYFVDCSLLQQRGILKEDTNETPLFVGPDSNYAALAQDYNIANGITYTSMIKNKYIDKVTTISSGIKMELRVKL